MEMFTFGLLCTCRTISDDISWSSFILENLSFSYSVLISDLFIFRRQESWCLHNGYFKYFVLVESQSTQPNESFTAILVLRATMIGANDHFDPFFFFKFWCLQWSIESHLVVHESVGIKHISVLTKLWIPTCYHPFIHVLYYMR